MAEMTWRITWPWSRHRRPTHIIDTAPASITAGDLVAWALVDVMSDGLSLVYSFYDPSQSRRSLGSFVILDHVIQACLMGLPYVYLGYWVRGSEKMDYKVRFSPIELLKPEGWSLVVGGAAKAANDTL